MALRICGVTSSAGNSFQRIRARSQRGKRFGRRGQYRHAQHARRLGRTDHRGISMRSPRSGRHRRLSVAPPVRASARCRHRPAHLPAVRRGILAMLLNGSGELSGTSISPARVIQATADCLGFFRFDAAQMATSGSWHCSGKAAGQRCVVRHVYFSMFPRGDLSGQQTGCAGKIPRQPGRCYRVPYSTPLDPESHRHIAFTDAGSPIRISGLLSWCAVVPTPVRARSVSAGNGECAVRQAAGQAQRACGKRSAA